MKIHILIIGTLPTDSKIGGAAVTLKSFVDSLTKCHNVKVTVVDTAGIRDEGFTGMVRFFKVLIKIIRECRRADIVNLQVAHAAFFIWGWVIYQITRLYNKPFIIRKFNGQDHRDENWFNSYLGEYIIRKSKVYLAETLRYTKLCRERGNQNVLWFPTTREFNKTNIKTKIKKKCRNFVYIGHVREIKGMKELAIAAARLPKSITINIYGPWFEDLSQDTFNGLPNVSYNGVLEPVNVSETMRLYDAAILPSKATSEGYPGSIFEAYGAGLPVIASRVGGIPEIVDESTGILINPGDAESLADAIKTIFNDTNLYTTLQLNAIKRADIFNTDRATDYFLNVCKSIINDTFQLNKESLIEDGKIPAWEKTMNII